MSSGKFHGTISAADRRSAPAAPRRARLPGPARPRRSACSPPPGVVLEDVGCGVGLPPGVADGVPGPAGFGHREVLGPGAGGGPPRGAPCPDAVALVRRHASLELAEAAASASVRRRGPRTRLRHLGERCARRRVRRRRPCRPRPAGPRPPTRRCQSRVHPRQHTSMTRLAGKVAIITGAGNGMGRAGRAVRERRRPRRRRRRGRGGGRATVDAVARTGRRRRVRPGRRLRRGPGRGDGRASLSRPSAACTCSTTTPASSPPTTAAPTETPGRHLGPRHGREPQGRVARLQARHPGDARRRAAGRSSTSRRSSPSWARPRRRSRTPRARAACCR